MILAYQILVFILILIFLLATLGEQNRAKQKNFSLLLAVSIISFGSTFWLS